MHRPLNWVVVGLSLLLLIVNMPTFGRRLQAPEIAVPTSFIEAKTTVLEFGYIRADGSFLPLARQPFDGSLVDDGTAELVWSTPWPVAAGKGKGEGASFTSASPSWR